MAIQPCWGTLVPLEWAVRAKVEIAKQKKGAKDGC